MKTSKREYKQRVERTTKETIEKFKQLTNAIYPLLKFITQRKFLLRKITFSNPDKFYTKTNSNREALNTILKHKGAERNLDKGGKIYVTHATLQNLFNEYKKLISDILKQNEIKNKLLHEEEEETAWLEKGIHKVDADRIKYYKKYEEMKKRYEPQLEEEKKQRIWAQEKAEIAEKRRKAAEAEAKKEVKKEKQLRHQSDSLLNKTMNATTSSRDKLTPELAYSLNKKGYSTRKIAENFPVSHATVADRIRQYKQYLRSQNRKEL